jgi:hypothetical protein
MDLTKKHKEFLLLIHEAQENLEPITFGENTALIQEFSRLNRYA